jgi:hypothetical protein
MRIVEDDIDHVLDVAVRGIDLAAGGCERRVDARRAAWQDVKRRQPGDAGRQRRYAEDATDRMPEGVRQSLHDVPFPTLET